MKLITHNMLTSHVKGVKNGYPLVINVRKFAERQNLLHDADQLGIFAGK